MLATIKIKMLKDDTYRILEVNLIKDAPNLYTENTKWYERVKIS